VRREGFYFAKATNATEKEIEPGGGEKKPQPMGNGTTPKAHNWRGAAKQEEEIIEFLRIGMNRDS